MRTDIVGPLEVTGIMRDIHPDEAYEFLGVQITAAWKAGIGNVMYFALARNSSAEEQAGIAEALTDKIGPLFHYEPQAISAAGTANFANTIYEFPEPIQFDENDSMNAWIYNSQAQTCTIVFTVYYRLT